MSVLFVLEWKFCSPHALPRSYVSILFQAFSTFFLRFSYFVFFLDRNSKDLERRDVWRFRLNYEIEERSKILSAMSWSFVLSIEKRSTGREERERAKERSLAFEKVRRGKSYIGRKFEAALFFFVETSQNVLLRELPVRAHTWHS